MVEIEFKNVSPRLTVGPTRVLLKLRPYTDNQEVLRFTRIAEQIAVLLRPRNLPTCRGRFNLHASHIHMHVGDRQKCIATFRYDNLGMVSEVIKLS